MILCGRCLFLEGDKTMLYLHLSSDTSLSALFNLLLHGSFLVSGILTSLGAPDRPLLHLQVFHSLDMGFLLNLLYQQNMLCNLFLVKRFIIFRVFLHFLSLRPAKRGFQVGRYWPFVNVTRLALRFPCCEFVCGMMKERQMVKQRPTP